MVIYLRLRALALSSALLATVPAHAASAPQARLVQCGPDTCLRLSGHRRQPTVAILVAGHDLAVAGARNWRATVPLATARAWGMGGGDVVPIAQIDAQGHAQSTAVALPPGALGRRVEIATLVVRAR